MSLMIGFNHQAHHFLTYHQWLSKMKGLADCLHRQQALFAI
jgi:hypothetical protein